MTLLWTVRDRHTGRSFQIVRCMECDLACTSPQLPPEALARYYLSAADVPRNWRQRLMNRLRAWLRRRRARYAAAGMAPGRALEIGCGDGRLLQELRAMGWQVLGAERDVASAADARRRAVDVCVVNVAQPGLPTASFDLVILWHALEHLHDPLGALREARRLLRDSGSLVVAVPNLASWQARILGAQWYHLDVPRHLFHFTPATLRALLEEAGFRPVAWSLCQPAYEIRGWYEALRRPVSGCARGVWAAWVLATPLAILWCVAASRARAGAAMVVRARPADSLLV